MDERGRGERVRVVFVSALTHLSFLGVFFNLEQMRKYVWPPNRALSRLRYGVLSDQ